MDSVLKSTILTELLPHGTTRDKEESNPDYMYEYFQFVKCIVQYNNARHKTEFNVHMCIYNQISLTIVTQIHQMLPQSL